MNHKYIEWLSPFGIGVLFFILIASPSIIDPQNIAWIQTNDPRTHYLGWLFFRNTDWAFPLGANPQFGLELGNAIVYSDSLPLLALTLKPFAGLLPDVFQYFGFWILVCFVLQAVLAWKLAGMFVEDRVFRAAFTVFCVAAPPFLFRLHGHVSLFSHFLILLSFVVYFSKSPKQGLYWAILVPVSALIHAYLLAMVSAIWLASMLDRLIQRRATLGQATAEALSAIILTGLVMWQAGYFLVISGTASGGYGYYRMNLLSLFDSEGWSFLLKNLVTGPGDYEGFNFWGAGAIILLLAALPIIPRLGGLMRDAMRAYPFLVACLVALTLFALSNTIGIGPYNLHFDIPRLLERIAGMFRSSGRMFWPVYYMLSLCLFLIVLRVWGRNARWWLAGAMIVQVVDTSAGWSFSEKMKQAPADNWSTPMVNSFWDHAAARYQDVRWIMPQNKPERWSDIAYYAARHGMGTSAIFLARLDRHALEAARATASRALSEGDYREDTLYILDVRSGRKAAQTLQPGDMLADVDGFTVLAPDCEDCAERFGLSPPLLAGPTRLNQRIAFSTGHDTRYLEEGWCEPEPWGIWSCGRTAVLAFAEDLPERFSLMLNARAFGPAAGADITVSTSNSSKTVQFTDDASLVQISLAGGDGSKEIRFSIPATASPKDLGINTDPRQLGIGVEWIVIAPD